MSAPGGAFAYPMILAALPHHGDLFSARRPPVSRIGLERRLALLPDADRCEIAAIEGLLNWDRAQRFASDTAFLDEAEATVARLRSQSVRALVEERLSMRSIVAALRMRAMGALAPRGRWGRTPHAWRIERGWERAGFGLGPAQAWVGRVEACMSAGDAMGAEREILGEVWRRLGRAGVRHPSGYVAILIYVLRWNVIDRWTRQNAQEAGARFAAWTARLAAGAAA
jgi:hypothetical protein